MSRTILTVVVISVCILAVESTATASPLSFEDGVVRLEGMATGGVINSIWAEDSSLYVTFPTKKRARRKTLRVKHDLIRKVRLTRLGRRRAQVELRLKRSAGTLLSQVSTHEINGDLLINIRHTPATADLAKNAAVAKVPASDKRVAPRTAPSPAPAKAAAEATPAPTAKKVVAAAAAPLPGKQKTVAGKGSLLAGKKVFGKKGLLGGAGANQRTPGLASFWVLLLVVGLGGALAWWLKRRKRGTLLDDASIEIISCRPLSGKHKLVLVEAGGEALLLGCTDKEIQLLRVLERKVAPAPILPEHRLDQHDLGAELAQSALEQQLQSAPVVDRVELSDQRQAPQGGRKPSVSSFMQQLTRQIQRREQTRTAAPPAPAQDDPGNPLDERWAQGIIRLRNARQTAANAAADTQPGAMQN